MRVGKCLKVSPALMVGVVGNLLALAWPAPLLFVPRGTYDETLPSIAFVLVSLVLLGLGGCVSSFLRGTRAERVTGVLGMALYLTPLPLYLHVINALCNLYGYCSGD